MQEKPKIAPNVMLVEIEKLIAGGILEEKALIASI